MDISDVKALTFDVFGTTVDWRSSVTREGEKVGKAKGIGAEWVAFADEWRELYFPSMDKVTKGELEWTKLDDLHRMSLDQLLDKFGIEGLREDEIANFNRAWHRLDPWPDSVEGLTRLKTKYIVAAMSNANLEMMVNMTKWGGLPWDVILGAEIAKCYKPEPEIYLTGASLLGLEPYECMMVSTHNFDLKASACVGFRTAYVYRKTAYGPNRTQDLEPGEAYDVIAEDFNDLADKLGC